MEISLRKVNCPYQRVTSTQFWELFRCLRFLENNQPTIILMPKRHILEVANLLSYKSLRWSMKAKYYPHLFLKTSFEGRNLCRSAARGPCVKYCEGPGQAALKYSTIACWLLWVKVTWPAASGRRAHWPSLNAGNKSPLWKVLSLLQQGKEKHLYL